MSMDSKKSSIIIDPIFEQKKIVTTTTINTQSNTDILELHPEFLKTKIKFEYEQNLKDNEKNFSEAEVRPSPNNCQFCGFQGTFIVVRQRENGNWFIKYFQKALCCCLGSNLEGRVDHVCPGCKQVIISFNE